MNNQTVIQDANVFEIDYVPETFQCRDEDSDKLWKKLWPAGRGSSPENVLIRGISGTGKTTVVNHIFKELDDASNQVIVVNVNCQTERTTFSVIARIFQAVLKYKPSFSGTSTYQAVDAIAQQLCEMKKVLVVCLDDANILYHHQHQHNHLNETLSYLLRLNEFCRGVRVGVVLTLSDMDFHLAGRLDASVLSSLHPKEILFRPYGEEAMFQILHERARLGFYPGAIEPDVIRQVARISYETSNLRIGIDLLKQSGFEAERDGRRTIESGDIHGNYRESRVHFLNSLAKDLAYKDRRLFWWVAKMKNEVKGMLLSGMLYDAFCTEVKEGYTSFYNRMKRLERLRLLNMFPCHIKGNSSEIVLRFDPMDVIAACESNEEDGVPEVKAESVAEEVAGILPEAKPAVLEKGKPEDVVATKPVVHQKGKSKKVTVEKPAVLEKGKSEDAPATKPAVHPKGKSKKVTAKKPKVPEKGKSEDVVATKALGHPKGKSRGTAAKKPVTKAASPQPGSVPVSAASGDAGGVMRKQPEPGALPERERKESGGFGRKRSQKGAVT